MLVPIVLLGGVAAVTAAAFRMPARGQTTDERRRYMEESRRIARGRALDPPGTVALFRAVHDLGHWIEPPERHGAADYTPDPVLVEETLRRISGEARRMTPAQATTQLAWMARKATLDEGKAFDRFATARDGRGPDARIAATLRDDAISARGFARAVAMAREHLVREGLAT